MFKIMPNDLCVCVCKWVCQDSWESLVLWNLKYLTFLVKIEYKLSLQEWNLGYLVDKTDKGFINLTQIEALWL